MFIGYLVLPSFVSFFALCSLDVLCCPILIRYHLLPHVHWISCVSCFALCSLDVLCYLFRSVQNAFFLFLLNIHFTLLFFILLDHLGPMIIIPLSTTVHALLPPFVNWKSRLTKRLTLIEKCRVSIL
jgi:hypothetical protein